MLQLEVARLPLDAFRQLRDHPPAEMLEGVARRIPRRQDGRPESLEMPVNVPRDRPDVMRRGHPPFACGRQPEDQDHAKP